MSEKVLQEYSQRIFRAKTLLETTKSQCAALRKEGLRLEKELEELQRAQRSAEAMEETLKNKYLAIKAANEQEGEKNSKEIDELNQLRDLKRKLKREHDICQADLRKNTLILEDLMNERMALEKMAKQFSEQLEQVTLEKNAFEEEHQKNYVQIQEYSQKVKELKNDIKNMRGLMSSSFGKKV